MKSQRPDVTRVGDVLLRMGTISQEQLTEAVQRQKAGDTRLLGTLLVELGFAALSDVELALLRQQALRGNLSHEESLRLLEEAREQAQRAGHSLADLASAAEELGGKKP